MGCIEGSPNTRIGKSCKRGPLLNGSTGTETGKSSLVASIAKDIEIDYTYY